MQTLKRYYINVKLMRSMELTLLKQEVRNTLNKCSNDGDDLIRLF